VRQELAWMTLESNKIGINEFAEWAKRAGTEVMMAVNLGTRGADAARNLVEYCNFPKGTYWSDLRRSHGIENPHHIKLWCLGNEMDSPWQICHHTADEYGRIAAEAGKVMKWTDPSIELVACGSTGNTLPTFGEWEYRVLEHAWDQVDYISLHQYYNNNDNDTPNFLAKSIGMDSYIKTVAGICDMVKARRKSKKTVHLSFDEWNVCTFNTPKLEQWQFAPPQYEDIYTMEDALAVGCILITLLRNADRVKIACLAQLVNALAPIIAEKDGAAWRQTIFFPFAQASKYGRGTVLRGSVTCSRHDTKDFTGVPDIEAAAVHNEGKEEITIFAVNRNLTESIPFETKLFDFEEYRLIEHSCMSSNDLKAVNSAAEETVKPMLRHGGRITESGGALLLETVLPPASWNIIRLGKRTCA
jgi:alpha-N-arabinofuranosidase